MEWIVLSTVESTNEYLRRLSEVSTLESGTAVLSMEQTAGKGQRGNRWLSNKGEGIYLSVYYRPLSLETDKSVLLSKAIACSLFQYVFSKLGSQNSVKIKWPNDVMVDGKKVGGILIENSLRGNYFSELIVGVGLNLNQKTFARVEFNAVPVSLYLLTQEHFEPEKEGVQLKEYMDHWMSLLENGRTEEVESCYQASLFQRDEIAFFESDKSLVSGKLKCVDASGAAVVISEGKEYKLLHPQYRMKAI